MKKRIHMLLAIFMCILMATAITVTANAASGDFAGGDGSKDNPYQIADKYQLNNVRNYPDDNFILINDIVFADEDFKEGGDFYRFDDNISNIGWESIEVFNGTFDGNGYWIKNLQAIRNIINVDDHRNPLFGLKAFALFNNMNGVVKNLGVEVFVDGDYQHPFGAGGGYNAPIAVNNYGIIENCFTTGKITGDACGVASVNDGVIRNVVNGVMLLSDTNCAWTGAYYESHNDDDLGHRCAITHGGIVENCVNISYVERGYFYRPRTSSSNIKGCIDLGTTFKGEGRAYQFEGANNSENTYILTTDNMGAKASYPTLDFENVWEYDSASYVPVLKDNPFAKEFFQGCKQLGKSVKNFTGEGYSYNKIKLSWDKTDGVVEYVLLIKSNQRDEFTTVLSKSETSYIEELKSKEIKTYVIIPIFEHNGIKYSGTASKWVTVQPIDTMSDDSDFDYVSPVLESIKIVEPEISKPGVLKLKIKATDKQTGISSISMSLGSEVGYKKSFSNVKNLDITLNIPVSNTSNWDFGTYRLGRITIKDKAGNEAYYNGVFYDKQTIVIKPEFDIEFTGVLSNGNIPTLIQNMDEGKTVVLKINEKSKGILKKEILDAIKGQDKTVVVYADSQGSAQWVFYGKDITGKTKDLDLNVSVSKISGDTYGCKGSLVKLKFANNGQLPGKVNFRVKSDYFKAINNLDDNLYLYYLNGSNVELTNSDCPVIKDGSSYWCYIDLEHNSTFILTAEKLKTSITIKASTSATSGKPVISWTKLEGDVTYKVYRATSSSGKYSLKGTVTGDSFEDTSASVGKKYYYKVKATAGGETTGESSVKYVTCKLAAPIAKVSVSTTSGKVKVSWKKISSAKKYEVYRATSTGSFKKLMTTSSTSYTDSSASVGTNYRYKVKAVASKSTYNSSYSETLTAKRICAQPDLEAKISTTYGKPSLSWDKVSGAKEYKILRAESQNGEYQLLTTTTSTSWTDKTAEFDKDYWYQVDVVGSKSGTDNDTDAAVKVHTTCAKPSVSIKISSKKPKVSWKPVEGATKYYVYRATSKSGKYTKVATVTDATSCRDSKAKKGKTYYYKVKAIAANSAANGAYSSVVKIKSK